MNFKNYSLAQDTLNGSIVNDKLFREIQSDVSIEIALSGVTLVGDVLTISFRAAVTTQQWENVDAIVSAHDGIPGVGDPQEIEMHTVLAEGGKRKTDRGFCFEVPAGTTYTYDYLVTADLQIKGGILFTDTQHIKDQVSLEIVDTGFLYVGDWYPAEYAPGVPWTTATPNGVPLHMYVGNFPVNPSGESKFENEAITTTPLNGLTIRLTYKSNGTSNVICNVGLGAYT